MRRTLRRLPVALLMGIIPAVLGTVAAVLYSDAGNTVLGRLAGQELSRLFRGQFTISRVSGTFTTSIELRDVVIRDTMGQLFASVPRLRVAYAAPNLLAGRFVFSAAELERPEVHIVKRANGRLNLHEIFRLGEGPGGGRSPLIEIRNLRLHDANVELRLPWNPPDTADTPQLVGAALAADRARPGRVVLQTPDGLRRVVELNGLTARLPRVRISSPDRSPLTFDVDSLSSRVSDPALTVVDLAAHAWTHGDSLAFTAHRAALPHSRFTGGGVITWPHGPVLYDFTLDAARLDLRDLHWVSPDFPDMTGRAVVTARSRSEQLTAYTLHRLDLRGRGGRISGDVTALTDQRRGLGVEDMAVELTDLDLDVPRPYLDTMPLHGTLTGRLSGAGFRDGLDLDADLVFRDAAIEGGATSTIAGSGHLILGGPDGTVFDTVVVAAADVDLQSVRLISPSVALRGRLQLAGVLRGPWRDVTYSGDLTHRDGDHPESRATGTTTLDTRGDTLRFETRLNVAPVVFDGLRPSYPGLVSQGAVSGLVAAEGTVQRFHLQAAVQGDLGALAVSGMIAAQGERIEADSLTARFSALDLALLRGGGPHTSLAGRLFADGALDTTTGPAGTLALDLGQGTIAELAFDTVSARVRAGNGLIQLDTGMVGWPAGRLAGSGRLPWREKGDQQLHAEFTADSLSPFEPFVERFTGPPSDSGPASAPLHGHLTGEVNVLGSVSEPRFLVWARGRDLAWREIRAPAVGFGFGWNRAERPEIGAALQADSVTVGNWVLTRVNTVAGGFQDSLRWLASGSLAETASFSAGGEWWSRSDAGRLVLDSLVAQLPQHAWHLRAPATVTFRKGEIEVSPVGVEASDGSGSLDVVGRVPRATPGDLRVSAQGVELRDVYSLLELDTAGMGGTLQLDLALGGTAAKPTARGTGSIADLSFGEFGSPFVQGVIDYADRSLDANLLMWKTGQPVLRVEARLPLDLALRSVPRRQVNGPLSVRAIADSTDLVVAEAFTRNLRRVRGTLRAVVEVAGTWESPQLGGIVEIRNASADVPGLGVHYDRVNALAHLAGDSVTVDSLVARSGEGNLRATGGLRLERLTRPVLDLTFRARRFRAIDVRRFLTLDATGTVRLTGPVFRAHLTGRMTADAGNLHFADLITKRIVDLENPGDSGLIDLNLIRSEQLGANFQSRFLDSLSIAAMQIQMGESFWLRSDEANIQLDGNLTVAKVRDRYRFDGTLNAVRGNYTLRIGGFVTRDFTVDRGTVRYFGTPDLNADLDIEASHTVIAVEKNEEIPVIARITGTMLQPRLELTSPPTAQRGALSQTELVSYLMFGRPTFSLQGQGTQGSQYAAVQAGVSYLTSAFSSELQRTLISDLGVPIDYLDIRPGTTGGAVFGGQGGSAQVAQVAAGWQIGRKWFVSLVADLCTNVQRFYPNAEFRMTREVRLKTSLEPTYSCQAAQVNPALSTNKYQVGLDVLWEREY